jgi:hypothetical protein
MEMAKGKHPYEIGNAFFEGDPYADMNQFKFNGS